MSPVTWLGQTLAKARKPVTIAVHVGVENPIRHACLTIPAPPRNPRPDTIHDGQAQLTRDGLGALSAPEPFYVPLDP